MNALKDGLCFKCQRANGNYPKDNGAHTARVKTCDGCGEVKPILPSRHYTNMKPKWFDE